MQVVIRNPNTIAIVVGKSISREDFLLSALCRRYGIGEGKHGNAKERIPINVKNPKLVAMMREEKRKSRISFREIAEDAIRNYGGQNEAGD